MKKLLYSVMTAVVLLGLMGNILFAFAEESGSQQLTLARSIEIAYANNKAITLAELDLTTAQVSLSKVRSGYKGLMDTKEYETLLQIINNLKPAQAKEKLAQKDVILAKQNVKTEVEQAYYEVLRAQKQVEIAKLGLSLAEKQQTLAENGYKAGSVSKSSVLTAQSNLANMKSDLLSAQNSLQLAYLSFNKALGWDLNTQVVLTDQFAYVPVTVDLGAKINQALEKRIEIAQKQDSLNLQKELSDLVSGAYAGTYDAKLQEAALKKAEIQLAQQKETVIQEVTEAYYNITNAQERISALQKGLTQAQESMKLTQTRFENGAATSLELMEAQNTLVSAQSKLNEAIFDYHIALAKLDLAAGEGL